MSWGETTCLHFGTCKLNVGMGGCNKQCGDYLPATNTVSPLKVRLDQHIDQLLRQGIRKHNLQAVIHPDDINVLRDALCEELVVYRPIGEGTIWWEYRGVAIYPNAIAPHGELFITAIFNLVP